MNSPIHLPRFYERSEGEEEIIFFDSTFDEQFILVNQNKKGLLKGLLVFD